MQFLIDTLDGETITSDLLNVGGHYPDDDVIYVGGVPCRLSTARSLERAALQAVLDSVDYTIGNCRSSEMVGAVLSKQVIELARKVLQG